LAKQDLYHSCLAGVAGGIVKHRQYSTRQDASQKISNRAGLGFVGTSTAMV
jgi:hypothetical protein